MEEPEREAFAREIFEPQYLDTVEDVRNRPDKSILAITNVDHAEKLLSSDVAYPEQVRHLWLNVSGSDRYDRWYDQNENKCKNLVNFINLETLVMYDVNLSSDLWIQFAHNSTRLREIVFRSNEDKDSSNDYFGFDTNKEGIASLLKIPTLENVVFQDMMIHNFPKGPSNIKHITFDSNDFTDNFTGDVKSMYQSLMDNFNTHTNITSVTVIQGMYTWKEDPFKISYLRLEKMEQLENIEFHGRLVDQDDITSFVGILSLPKLKHLNVFIENCTECLRFEGSVDETDKVNAFKSELENGTRFFGTDGIYVIKDEEDKIILANNLLYF